MFNRGFTLSPEAADKLLKGKELPKEFYDINARQVVDNRDKVRYAEFVSIIRNYIEATVSEEKKAREEKNALTKGVRITNLDEIIAKGSGRVEVEKDGVIVEFVTFDIAIDPESDSGFKGAIKRRGVESNEIISDESDLELAEARIEKAIQNAKSLDDFSSKISTYTFDAATRQLVNQFVLDRLSGKTTQSFSEWRSGEGNAGSRTAMITHVQKKDPTKNKGIGFAAYLELGNRLAEKGITLISTPNGRHDNGTDLWNKLVNSGYATGNSKTGYSFIVKGATPAILETIAEEAEVVENATPLDITIENIQERLDSINTERELNAFELELLTQAETAHEAQWLASGLTLDLISKMIDEKEVSILSNVTIDNLHEKNIVTMFDTNLGDMIVVWKTDKTVALKPVGSMGDITLPLLVDKEDIKNKIKSKYSLQMTKNIVTASKEEKESSAENIKKQEKFVNNKEILAETQEEADRAAAEFRKNWIDALGCK